MAVGLFESGFYPGYVCCHFESVVANISISMHFILGSWYVFARTENIGALTASNYLRYTPRELAKRSVAFGIAGTLGTVSSSFFATATYKTLNGAHGLAGWR